VTPWVVAVLIVAGTVVVLAVLAAVTYLTARGFDPEPIVQLTGTLVAAAAASGNFALSLVKRKTETNVQRQVGRLATGVEVVVEELDASRGRHAPPAWDLEEEERGTAPAGPGSADLDQDVSSTRAPGRGPFDSPERYSDTPQEDLHDTAWFRQ
jgi:hypothetical protein